MQEALQRSKKKHFDRKASNSGLEFPNWWCGMTTREQKLSCQYTMSSEPCWLIVLSTWWIGVLADSTKFQLMQLRKFQLQRVTWGIRHLCHWFMFQYVDYCTFSKLHMMITKFIKNRQISILDLKKRLEPLMLLHILKWKPYLDIF